MSKQNKEIPKEETTEELVEELDIENAEAESKDEKDEIEEVNQDDLISEILKDVEENAMNNNVKSFKKVKKDKKDTQIEELTDRLKRTMAEFDNYRKRTEKEKSQMYDVGAKNIIEKILPVIDNFDRGLASVTNKEDSFAQGIEMVYKQLMTTLEEIGVKPIEALDQQFDLNFHNAVMHIDDEELGENVIVEEFQKGYTYRDMVIRHSMVKVAN